MTSAEILEEYGYEDIVIFSDYSYDGALVGVSNDNRAIYDYGLMVEWLVAEEGFTEDDAVEWIDFNTIRALPYMRNAPIIMYAI